MTNIEDLRRKDMIAVAKLLQNKYGRDVEGYKLLMEEGHSREGFERLQSGLRNLALSVRDEMRINATREDMMEIEHLLKKLELEEEEAEAKHIIQTAREAEVRSILTKQELEWRQRKAQQEEEAAAELANELAHKVSLNKDRYFDRSTTALSTRSETEYTEVEYPETEAIDSEIEDGDGPGSSQRRKAAPEYDDESYSLADNTDARKFNVFALIGSQNEERSFSMVKRISTSSLPRNAEQTERGSEQGGAGGEDGANNNTREGEEEEEEDDVPKRLRGRRRSKVVPIKTTFSGFALHKGAAKRLSKNIATNEIKASRRRSEMLEPMAPAVVEPVQPVQPPKLLVSRPPPPPAAPIAPASQPVLPVVVPDRCTYLGNCTCRDCISSR